MLARRNEMKPIYEVGQCSVHQSYSSRPLSKRSPVGLNAPFLCVFSVVYFLPLKVMGLLLGRWHEGRDSDSTSVTVDHAMILTR